MTEAAMDSMRASRRSPHVALHQFNSLRSRHARLLICVFEGGDDVAFFDTIFRRLASRFEYLPLVVSGKDQVLGLRALIKRSEVHDRGLVRFFIDRDFDMTKGHETGPDLYVTPTYSIENLLVSEEILTGLLRAEFRCSDEHGDLECSAVMEQFRKCQNGVQVALADANLLIFFARTKQQMIVNIDESIGKYVDVGLDGVKAKVDRTALLDLIVFREQPDWADVDMVAGEFRGLNPVADWRGKFWLAYFRKFLGLLRDDRNSEAPNMFRARAKVRFDPNADIVRALAMLCQIPRCLADFVRAFPA